MNADDPCRGCEGGKKVSRELVTINGGEYCCPDCLSIYKLSSPTPEREGKK